MRKIIAYVGLVVSLVFVSGLIPTRLRGAELPDGTYSVCEKMGDDVVAAAGWPFAFIYDGNVTSPVCSTGWSQVALFEDVLWVPHFVMTVGLCMIIVSLLFLSVRLFKSHKTKTS